MKLADILKELDKSEDFELVIRPKSSLRNPEGEGDDESSSLEFADDKDLGEIDSEVVEAPLVESNLDPEILEVLKEVSSTVEGLVDKVMDINKNKEYSKLVKLLRSAVRLTDDLIESDELTR